MSIKLRELIRNVRACKTAAEERGVIAKECALIRTEFKSKDTKYRHRNVAKLLYIHMLGYPTHFGQMESLKLIASPRFPEKRIGYLGLMILLDERQKVLMLVTNSLKNDFRHKNPYIVGLALASFGNICSADMARDLANEVEKFFKSPNPYLRKKACLCAVRVIRKVPELIEEYVDGVIGLLNDKNHAVLLTAITLIIEMIRLEPNVTPKFRKLAPQVVRLLKSLVLAGYVSEYDVVGITDPFLQGKLIHLLRLLGTGDAEASDAMNDILAQVAINTEPTKNPGNAILYECVNTIMSIEAENGLRVLAINILGRFLLNRDNNIRYVALNTLCRVVARDVQAIQRHRNVVVDCLKDADISIRRRALDLIYALVTKSNVRALVKELLNYLALTSGDSDFKADLTDKICVVVEKYAPSRRWHIDTILSVLATAGTFTRAQVATDLIVLIARSTDLYAYSAHAAFQSLKKGKVTERALIHVAVWCVGEYGDLLISEDGAKKANVDEKLRFEAVPEGKLLDVMKRLMKSPVAKSITRQYLLNALVKLSSRFTVEQDRLNKLIGQYKTSMSLELQQRSVEYSVLTSNKLDKIRPGVVARMPIPVKRVTSPKDESKTNGTEAEAQPDKEEDGHEDDDKHKKAAAPKDAASKEKERERQRTRERERAERERERERDRSRERKKAAEDAEEEDDDDDDVDRRPKPSASHKAAPKSEAKSPPPPAASKAAAASRSALPIDIEELFGGGSPAASPPQPTTSVASRPADPVDFMRDIFENKSASSSSASASSDETFPSQRVFENNGLAITFSYSRPRATPHILNVTATFVNNGDSAMTMFDFQVSLPKFIKLSLNPPSSVTLERHGPPITQYLLLDNSQHGKRKIQMRVRIVYTKNGQSVTEEAAITQFPD